MLPKRFTTAWPHRDESAMMPDSTNECSLGEVDVDDGVLFMSIASPQDFNIFATLARFARVLEKVLYSPTFESVNIAYG